MKNPILSFLLFASLTMACNEKPGSTHTIVLRDSDGQDYSGEKGDDLDAEAGTGEVPKPDAGDAVVPVPPDGSSGFFFSLSF